MRVNKYGSLNNIEQIENIQNQFNKIKEKEGQKNSSVLFRSSFLNAQIDQLIHEYNKLLRNKIFHKEDNNEFHSQLGQIYNSIKSQLLSLYLKKNDSESNQIAIELLLEVFTVFILIICDSY